MFSLIQGQATSTECSYHHIQVVKFIGRGITSVESRTKNGAQMLRRFLRERSKSEETSAQKAQE